MEQISQLEDNKTKPTEEITEKYFQVGDEPTENTDGFAVFKNLG